MSEFNFDEVKENIVRYVSDILPVKYEHAVPCFNGSELYLRVSHNKLDSYLSIRLLPGSSSVPLKIQTGCSWIAPGVMDPLSAHGMAMLIHDVAFVCEQVEYKFGPHVYKRQVHDFTLKI